MPSGEKRPDEEREGKTSLWNLDKLIDGKSTPAEMGDASRSALDSPLAAEYLAEPPEMDLETGWERFRTGTRARPSAEESARKPPRPESPGWLAWLGPRPGIAFAALPLIGGLVFFSLNSAPDPVPAFRTKGGGEVEVRIKINGKEFPPGASIPATAGDTAYILYRTPEPAHVSVWYRQDQGEPQELDGERPEPWPAALGWKVAPQAALLDGEWREQRIWVLTSNHPITKAESEGLLAGRETESSSHADSFLLLRSAP